MRLMHQQLRRKNDQIITLKCMLDDLKSKELLNINQVEVMNMLDGSTGQLFKRLIQQKNIVPSSIDKRNCCCFS